MKPEEKFDRSVRNIIRNDIPEQPSRDFTDGVMEKLGVRRIHNRAITKPILSKNVKIGIAAAYIVLLGLIIVFSKESTPLDSRYIEMLPKIQWPSFSSLIKLNTQVLTLLIFLIGGGWLLAGFDRVLKKYILR